MSHWQFDELEGAHYASVVPFNTLIHRQITPLGGALL